MIPAFISSTEAISLSGGTFPTGLEHDPAFFIELPQDIVAGVHPKHVADRPWECELVLARDL